MDLKRHFSTDRELEEQGVWVDIGEGAMIKVARVSNSRARAAYDSIRSIADKVVKKYISVQDDQAKLIAVVASTILLDWKGMEWEGENLPYNVQNATKVLTECQSFLELVIELASESETFRRQQIEELKEELGKS